MSGEFPDERTLGRIEARAVAYAREAGHLLLARRRLPLEVVYKSKGMRNPVTGLDKELESFLQSAIAADFPGHAILGEEGAGFNEADKSEFCWVLDPLDGTTNFVNGLPFFAVSVAVLHRFSSVVGAIFSPQTHLGSEGVFHAARGRGAFLEDVPLHFASEAEPTPGRLVSVPGSYRRFQIDRELRKRHGDPRVLGSVALEMALTSAGVFQFAVFGAPKIWDVAAGVLLVREAGGSVLAGGGKGEFWENLQTFAPPPTDKDVRTDLRSWARPLIAGSAGVAAFVAQHLRLRAKSEARGRSDSSRDGGKRGSR